MIRNIIILIISVVIIYFGAISIIHLHERTIKKWSIEHKMKVKTIEHRITIIGSPFNYQSDGQFIYKVSMTNGEKWWVRTSLFGNDYIKDK